MLNSSSTLSVTPDDKCLWIFVQALLRQLAQVVESTADLFDVNLAPSTICVANGNTFSKPFHSLYVFKIHSNPPYISLRYLQSLTCRAVLLVQLLSYFAFGSELLSICFMRNGTLLLCYDLHVPWCNRTSYTTIA